MDHIVNDGEVLPVISHEVTLNNERGMVLIVVLVMLVLLSILGATVLTNSTTELRVTGNYRNQQQAFFAADGGFEQGQLSNAIYSVIPNVGDNWTGTISYTTDGVVTITQNAVAAAGAVNTAQVVAENNGSGPMPPGSGYDETFQANLYDLDVTGYGANNTEIEINSSIAKVQQKSKYY
ncbi:MAG: pilus assembly PilX N-terminal domain-containing protein [Deltaproteobacteria bacterium]|nr:pilus assembly PilX N-terminal domain-containing protein [Deltaproteobacteria bacterium]